MAGDNGRTALPDEERDHLLERNVAESRRAREAAESEAAAGAGWALGGLDPYADDWDIDLRVPPFEEMAEGEGAVRGGFKIPSQYEVDAMLLEVRAPRKSARLRECEWRRHRYVDRAKLDERRSRLAERSTALREAWGAFSDPFAYGVGLGAGQSFPGGLGLTGTYVPLLPGPVTRQLYWQDYFAMSAKAFEAYNHDPLSWRCVHMKQEFALGKGLQTRVTKTTGQGRGQRHERAAEVWAEFWKRNKMDVRFDLFCRDVSVMGEQFLRYFPLAPDRRSANWPRLTVRSLDPASIYDLITDQEDIESVYGYHQQFQTAYQLWAPPGNPPMKLDAAPPSGTTDLGATTRYVIRQILAREIDHYKINAGAYERRGRSDLFPALGWIKRLRDYLTSHVIRGDLLARICWDLQVDGGAPAIAAQRAALFPGGMAPPPGTVFGHNSKSTLTPLVPQGSSGGSRWDPVLDALVTMVATSIGLPKDWLGFGMGSTRASALVATEPAARSLEDLQGLVEFVAHDSFDRVMAAAGITDAELEVTFPSIATEDRSAKLKDVAFAESMGWVSHETASSIAAKELGITEYSYEDEQSSIAAEFDLASDTEDVPGAEPDPVTGDKPQRPLRSDGVVRRIAVNSSYRQIPKIDVTKSSSQEDEPPGLLVPVGAGEETPGEPSQNGNGGLPTRNGFPADENPLSGAGARNIRQDNTSVREAEPVFTAAHLEALSRAGLLRERRRRPDDPGFRRAAEEYGRATRENLDELLSAAPGAGAPERRE